VIAAVNVVLPWSTCPIVPMLQWGLDLSNFSLDILFQPPLVWLGFLSGLQPVVSLQSIKSKSGALDGT
jgi:hypothetical protein